MLPRSCLRAWLSKSNSSTRVPSRTTTRVSSAWAASISIFLVITNFSAARGGHVARAPAYVWRAASQRFAASFGCGGDLHFREEGAAHQVVVPNTPPSHGKRSFFGRVVAVLRAGPTPGLAHPKMVRRRTPGCATHNVAT